MCSIIPGISEQLAYNYLQCYNHLKFTFIVVDETGAKHQFKTCDDVAKFTDFEFLKPNYDIPLYKVFMNNFDDNILIELNNAEIIAIVNFENDDQLYMVFEMYAEKMSRPGRLLNQDYYEEDAYEEEEEL